ncbi:But2 family protein, similar to cell surface molecule [Schizosaccharomyces osmophilus]|uniref:But2 family protein, similar to cell surface molecule n=1 Tax=Schizosaccharomyces osmophilus TaxID=2545709 RepID=A0AAF0AY68_9SCHI|nr:But2 family protein, similar to cell surface molecule [Schizosaccharomyces osmophilus]WBW74374.1 But2 family protein, similar to cell surface molecule [Schizosaccharomyces osmophilus]
MKLFSSNFSIYTLLSLLAYAPTSSFAAPFFRRSGIQDNQPFSVMTLRSGNLYVHFHSLYVGESGSVYLDPYDHVNKSSVFTVSNGHLIHENDFAHLGDSGALVFTSKDEGSAEGFSFGEEIAGGYLLNYKGQGFVACPVKEDSPVYSVYYGQGNGDSNCVGFGSLAGPFSSSSSSASTAPTSAASSNAKVQDVVPTGSSYEKNSGNGPAPIFPNGIRLTNTSSPDSNSGNVYSPVAYQKENDHVNTIFTFDVPQVSDQKCQLHFHIDKNGFPIQVDGSNGVGEFVFYNLSSAANDGTTWANTPNRIAEVGRFNCSSNGCDYTTNITCPGSYKTVSYELSAITDKSYLEYFEEINPLEGLQLTV